MPGVRRRTYRQYVFFFQAEDGIRDYKVTGVQTCALPISLGKKIAIIGAGNMGEALIAGMLAAKAAAPDEIHATDILPQRLDHLKARYQIRSEEHTSELQSPCNLVCRLLLEKKKVN